MIAGTDPGSRWTAYQTWLVCLTAVTIVFDGMDNQLLGIAIPSLMREWSVPRSAFAPVVSLSLAGMMIGGAIAGILGDRFGRRIALLGSMGLFGACTTAIAAVDGVSALAILRFATGLGLGGAMPNATALAAEYVPANRSALAVTITVVCVPLGGTLAGSFAIPALPVLGWRGLFIAGGLLPLALVAVLARLLPESPQFVARAAGTRATLADLFTAELGRDTWALWLAFFSSLFGAYLGFSWLPSIISGAGLGTNLASTSITVFNLGGVVTAIACGVLITRFGSRRTMLPMTAGAALGSAILSQIPLNPETPVLPLLAALAFTGGLVHAVQTTLYALAAHVYPTGLRATGVGAAVSIGRIGAVLSGYAGPWALAYRGTPSFFALMAVSVLVTLLALAIVKRHVPGSQARAAA